MNASVHQLAPERRLRRLELTITRRLDGLLHGQHLGLLPGAGSELAGSREYRPGEDEVRFMDWAVTARTTVPHVREVDADRELTTWLLVDATPSMDFGTAEIEKRELAVAATAAVGFLTHGAGNKLGAHVRGPDGVHAAPGPHRAHPPVRHAAHAAGPAAGRRRSAPRCRSARRWPACGGRRPGAVSPSWSRISWTGCPSGADPSGRTPLRRLAARHQVLAVEVTDPRELELPDVGMLTLVDPETGQRREVSTGEPAAAGAVRRRGGRPARSRSRRRCAGPAPRTFHFGRTGTGSPTSCGTCTRSGDSPWPRRPAGGAA